MNHCKRCQDWGLCWRDMRCHGTVTPAPKVTIPEPEPAPVPETPPPAPKPVRKKSVKKTVPNG